MPRHLPVSAHQRLESGTPARLADLGGPPRASRNPHRRGEEERRAIRDPEGGGARSLSKRSQAGTVGSKLLFALADANSGETEGRGCEPAWGRGYTSPVLRASGRPWSTARDRGSPVGRRRGCTPTLGAFVPSDDARRPMVRGARTVQRPPVSSCEFRGQTGYSGYRSRDLRTVPERRCKGLCTQLQRRRNLPRRHVVPLRVLRLAQASYEYRVSGQIAEAISRCRASRRQYSVSTSIR